MKINAVKFQSMLSKAVKGAGNNRLIPITNLLGINLKDNVLTLTTTDNATYLYVKENIIGEDFNVTVELDKFYKLISKITSSEIELEIANDILIITGNGQYKLELPYDEYGKIISYPNPFDAIYDKLQNKRMIPKSVFSTILNSVKPALSNLLVDSGSTQYLSYYCGDKVVATDSNVISAYLYELSDKAKLIRPEVINLIDIMDTDKVAVYEYEDIIVALSLDCIIYSKVIPQIEEFNISAINSLLDTSFNSMCCVDKNCLFQLLDRFTLFVDKYDNNAIKLTFGKDILTVTSLNSGALEELAYTNSQNPVEFECYIDLELFKAQVKSQVSNNVELWYGLTNSIKITDNDIVKVIALLNVA